MNTPSPELQKIQGLQPLESLKTPETTVLSSSDVEFIHRFMEMYRFFPDSTGAKEFLLASLEARFGTRKLRHEIDNGKEAPFDLSQYADAIIAKFDQIENNTPARVGQILQAAA